MGLSVMADKRYVPVVTRGRGDNPLRFTAMVAWSFLTSRQGRSFSQAAISRTTGLGVNTLPRIMATLEGHGLTDRTDDRRWVARGPADHQRDWFVWRKNGSLATWKFYILSAEAKITLMQAAVWSLIHSFD